ncbi:MAG: hypothetical protein VKL39_08035 [Leptolyngbyaceae bacterium]|nr:hypothetical protein [Leptolyngbyaceae bacterium]
MAAFLTIGTAPAGEFWFDRPDTDIGQQALPQVWTDGDDPTLADLRFLRGMRVHLDIGDGPRHSFWQWWAALEAAEAAHIIGIEPDGEVVQWQA